MRLWSRISQVQVNLSAFARDKIATREYWLTEAKTVNAVCSRCLKAAFPCLQIVDFNLERSVQLA
jgi:hypothetical protein